MNMSKYLQPNNTLRFYGMKNHDLIHYLFGGMGIITHKHNPNAFILIEYEAICKIICWITYTMNQVKTKELWQKNHY